LERCVRLLRMLARRRKASSSPRILVCDYPCRVGSRIDKRSLESAMPLLEHNIQANAVFLPENAGARPEAMVLDWDDEVIPERVVNISKQRGFDVIVCVIARRATA
jgi:hypothetical protein